MTELIYTIYQYYHNNSNFDQNDPFFVSNSNQTSSEREEDHKSIILKIIEDISKLTLH